MGMQRWGNKSKSLLVLSNYLLGEASVKILAIIFIPVITRLVTPADYGYISIYIGVLSLMSIVLPLNLPASLRPRFLKHPTGYSSYAGTILVCSLLFSLILFLILFTRADVISSYFKIPLQFLKISLVSSLILIVKEVYQKVLLSKGESGKYAKFLTFYTLSEYVLTILLILYISQNKYLGKGFASIINSILFLVFSFHQLQKHVNWGLSFKYLKHAILFSLPLIIHATSHFILAQFDRLIINQLINSESTGFYSLAYSTGSLLMVIISAVNHYWLPTFFKSLKSGDVVPLNNKLQVLSGLVMFSAFLLTIFSGEIILILAPEEYSGASKIIPIIVLANVFIYMYMLFANYSFFSGKTLVIAVNTSLAGLVNIILNYCYIPRYGIIAAAYTTLVSYMLLFVLHFLCTFLIYKEFPRLKIGPVFFKLAIFVLITVLLNFILPFFDNYLKYLIKIIVSIIIGISLFWKLRLNHFFQ